MLNALYGFKFVFEVFNGKTEYIKVNVGSYHLIVFIIFLLYYLVGTGSCVV